ncbi:MAG TPA: tetratricopeptide repeat protein [Candidatus Paceibacterota bacterium]|nr:tetratricopeptide repeat protein [Candidatus Paceibacterota bacterium]
MKFFSAIAILLALALTQAHAQEGPDSQYVAIYSQMQQADSFQSSGQTRQALDAYVGAQSALQKFQKVFPDWDRKIVSYRLDYLAGKIAALTALLPPLTNAPPQTEPAAADTNASTSIAGLPSQLGGLRAQVLVLQSANATLQAKLKEALAVRPAAVNPDEFAQAQAQILSLMKTNDLLKASLAQISARPVVTNVVETPVANPELARLQAQVKSLQSEMLAASAEKLALQDRIRQLQAAATNPPPASAQTANEARLRELDGEVETLRTRLAVDEARAVPYTPDELALLKQPEPESAASSGTTEKPPHKLPPGSEKLVAEAQNYFAAKEFDKAALDYRKILQRDPDNPLALGNLAAIELEQGRLDDAEKHIKAALAQNPDDAYNLSILGYVKFRQEKFDDALDALSRAAKLDPQNPEIENYLGVTLSHKGLRTQAETALRKAIEINPNYAAAQNNLAVIYISDEPPSPELARYHYQKALDAGQPRNPELEKMLAAKGVPVNPQ